MNKNALVLAYIGDSIYELKVREYLINKNISKVNILQKEAIKYVSAGNQTKFLKELIDNNFFTEEELRVIMNARNQKNNHKPRNCDIITYKYATGLEALIGYLYLNNKNNRIDEIMEYILNGK